MADSTHYVRSGGAWVSDAPKTSSHDGWSITECIRNGFCTLSATKTYQGSTAAFNGYVKGYEPPAPHVDSFGTLACRVGWQVVSHGFCSVSTRGLMISFNGYGNSVSLTAGITYPVKYGV